MTNYPPSGTSGWTQDSTYANTYDVPTCYKSALAGGFKYFSLAQVGLALSPILSLPPIPFPS